MTSKRYPNLPADAEESARAVSEPQAAGIASAGRRGKRGGPRPETEAKYREAVELYVATDLTGRQICERCGVPLGGFRSYLRRFHRELVFARHGVICSEPQAAQQRLRGKRGGARLLRRMPNIGRPSPRATTRITSNSTSRRSPAASDSTVRGLPTSCGVIIRTFSNAGNRSAGGGGLPTISSGACVRGAGSSMPEPWSCCELRR